MLARLGRRDRPDEARANVAGLDALPGARRRAGCPAPGIETAMDCAAMGFFENDASEAVPGACLAAEDLPMIEALRGG